MSRDTAIQLIRGWGFAGLLVTCVAWSRPIVAQVQVPAQPPTDAKKNGQPPEKGTAEKDLADKAKFIAALDDIESQIVEQERYGEYGTAAVMKYVQELEREYFANEDALARLDESEVAAIGRRRQDLTARRQHLALLLWQLKRTGSQIGHPGFDSRKLTTQTHKLLSEHRSVMRDANLMKRFQSITRRLSLLSRQRITNSQLQYNFHFVHPTRPTSDRNVIPIPGPVPPDGAADGDFPDGPIQTLRQPIGNLIGLRWHDGRLSWDEAHWETPFAGFDLKTIQLQINTELEKRGINVPEQDRIVAQRNQRLFDTPRPILLFQDLQQIAANGKPPSRSYSTSGTSARSRFTVGDIEASIATSPQKREFTIREDSGPSRTLAVRSENDRSLRISLIGEHILLLDQYPDGSVRWVSIGDDVISEKASSFAKLYAQHPERIESELFSRLRHCGVDTPLQRFDRQLVSRVMDQIKGVDQPTRQRFAHLVTQIDSGNFADRQKAYRELSDNIESFSTLLLRTSDEDGRSAEATARLAELRKQSGERFLELDRLIESTGWLNDPRYLIGLGQRVRDDQSDLIAQRLESVTGQSFGDDWQRWQRWIAGR
ncbi:hypothetical protein Mal15_60720 [Stieleria maiorica]|uniref:Uncharacterized protein n=1 Tax=Stieleria maiorica TaxID=2795974 RepID=A0A5B9ML44_9BACT|nr:hypothetical protein [Stieleria maiorica]QEG01989.1 hypothetical protein Mal15_60720 [Stieleria maiorica]